LWVEVNNGDTGVLALMRWRLEWWIWMKMVEMLVLVQVDGG